MNSTIATRELPTYYISHGGGPWSFIPGQRDGVFSKLARSLANIPMEVGSRPRAVLAISGHWEEDVFTVMSGPNPSMVYDYSGFPPFTYSIRYPAPGSPEVAAQVQQLLESAGIPVRTDPHRGFDHGIFSPFAIIYPEADVPIVQLSVKRGYDPAMHLAVGRALAPLRRQGILIVGSGSSYHNLRQMGVAGHLPSHRFDAWLDETLCRRAAADRSNLLLKWENAPSAREAHPEEDHLVPLFVAAGAAERDLGAKIYFEGDLMGGLALSSFRFG